MSQVVVVAWHVEVAEVRAEGLSLTVASTDLVNENLNATVGATERKIAHLLV